ncbi:MAG: hypothetical protein ACTHVE_11570 [Senegalia sp. (in: firmicutes)]|uniref:hypothetical protein n=1 Tax=Senegalia sp. (in: firmicutes) TaxID=1924098 RepID=UPI003F9E16F5
MQFNKKGIKDIENKKSYNKNQSKVVNLSHYKKYNLNGIIREFEDRYEYVIYKDYEYIDNMIIHGIPINNLNVQIIECLDNNNLELASIEFNKYEFEVRNILEWINKYNIIILENNKDIIYKAHKIIDGIKFKNIPILLYEKGNQKLECPSDLIEITQKFIPERNKIDTKKSKELGFNKSHDNKKVIFDDKKDYGKKIIYNGRAIDKVPVIEFDLSKDLIISNGNVIVCDYIGPYCDNTLGFYQGDYKGHEGDLPVSFLLDMDTPVYIDIEIQPHGGKLCVISYNYIIEKDLY